jgi:ribose 5-phosphate isomerase B
MDAKHLAIACDHTGAALRDELIFLLNENDFTVDDYSPAPDARTGKIVSCDYPDVAQAVTNAVLAGEAARVILICGTGLGMSYAANRRPGIRAALCWSKEVARLARDHNDSNILVLSARTVTLDPPAEIMLVWLSTPFSRISRHKTRIEKLDLPMGAAPQP